MGKQDLFPRTLESQAAKGAPELAEAAPQRLYTDPAQLAKELSTVFVEDWVMVGRSGEAPNPGDYFTALLGQKPIIVMRQSDGSLKAMGNFCLHRYAKLLKGSGTAKRIVCPYHRWTYDMNGALIGAPDRDGFRREDVTGRTLAPLACDEHLGFVFVSVRTDLKPLSERFAAFDPMISNFDLGAYEDRYVVQEEVWFGNWKLIVENFIESYHTTYTHVDSIGPTNPTQLAEFGPVGDPGFAIHSNSYRPDDYPAIHNQALTEEERRRFYVISLFPNGLAALDANFVWWMALEPLGVDRTNARWGLSFSPHTMAGEKDAEAFVAEIRKVIETATVEDKEMVGRVQEGCGFDTDMTGRLHTPLEYNIKEFYDYLGIAGK